MACNYVNMASDVLVTCTEVPANDERQEEAVVDCVVFFTKREKVVRILEKKTNFAAKSTRERRALRSSRNVFGEYINYRMKICTSCIF